MADVEFEKEEKSNTYDAAAVGLSNINPQVHEEEFLRHVDADSFTSIHNVNKVWSYKNMTDGCWTNFDCTDCIQIELAYSIYSKTFDDQFATVDLVVGQVNLKDDTLKVTDSNGHLHIMDVQRSNHKVRKRPNAAERHEPFVGATILSDHEDCTFTYDTDLEWLSLNWRKFRASQISASFRRLILYMFESDFDYFPTLREIRDGLIGGQMEELEKQK